MAIQSDISDESRSAIEVRSRGRLTNAMNGGGADLIAGLKAWPLWTMLGWADIRQRYRRSVLGPFWITLSMAIFVVLLGIIYSRLFEMDIATYLPYVAVGLITWSFISGTTIESANAFVENAGLIKQIRLPFSLFVLRTVWRAFIIFLHTIVLIVPIGLYFGLHLSATTLLFIPGLALVFLNQIWVSIAIAILSTRYRDIPQLIATAVQITMFATPIMWPASALRGATLIVDINPVHHLLEVVRGPLIGEVPPMLSWIVVICMCLVGFAFTTALLHRASRRIVYWL
jgi:lipopolysaccharide transport system permease protein